MRVLFVAMRWDYKDPSRGESFEFANLWDSLRRHPGVEAEFFPFDELEHRIGREEMNAQLIRHVEQKQPELVVFFLFEDELSHETVARISTMTTTINWFADDQWRYETFSRRWAPHLTWVATTDPEAYEKYRSDGYDNALLTQWGCNHYMYRPVETERDLAVSFVGQPHGDRPGIVEAIRSSGVKVDVWGHGWGTGRLSQTEMIEVFSRSKVNLNLSNASRERSLRQIGGLFFRRRGRLIVPALGRIGQNLRQFASKGRDQIKGRNFEIPGCRTLLLTTRVQGLEQFFDLGKEIEVFGDLDELIDKCRQYVGDADARESIARAGYERTLRDHTYEKRFDQLFKQMGLK